MHPQKEKMSHSALCTYTKEQCYDFILLLKKKLSKPISISMNWLAWLLN